MSWPAIKFMTSLLAFGIAIMATFFGRPVMAQADQPNQQYFGTVQQRTQTAEGAGYQVFVRSGDKKGTTIKISENALMPETNSRFFRVGDRVVVTSYETPDGPTYAISDFDRTTAIWVVLGLFIIAVLWFTRSRGARSLVGLLISLGVLVLWIIPAIGRGANPIPTTILGATIILAATFLLTEGKTRLTAAALGGTIGALSVAGIISAWAVRFAHLTGTGSEESFALQTVFSASGIDLQGLLLAGILVGTLGVLDDVAISQAAIVAELSQTNQRIRPIELYQRAMRVGRSHLVAIINTLALAYAGTALPLLVLFRLSDQPFLSILNNELVATEIVRTVLGSLGLLLAVPLTTILAVWFRVQPHGHSHQASGHVH